MAQPTKLQPAYVPKRRTDRNIAGKVARRLRNNKELTRDELVARAQVLGWNISTDVLKKIERGEREVTDIELKMLAKVLKVSANVLLE